MNKGDKQQWHLFIYSHSHSFPCLLRIHLFNGHANYHYTNTINRNHRNDESTIYRSAQDFSNVHLVYPRHFGPQYPSAQDILLPSQGLRGSTSYFLTAEALWWRRRTPHFCDFRTFSVKENTTMSEKGVWLPQSEAALSLGVGISKFISRL